jgi:hypothetical protein
VIALVVAGLLLAGFAAGWVLGMAYGVHREQEREADRAFWIAVARSQKRILPLYDQDVSDR